METRALGNQGSLFTLLNVFAGTYAIMTKKYVVSVPLSHFYLSHDTMYILKHIIIIILIHIIMNPISNRA